MKPLSPWSQAVKIEMIKRNLSVSDIAKQIGKTREYTSRVIHGRTYAEPTMKQISDLLNIHDDF